MSTDEDKKKKELAEAPYIVASAVEYEKEQAEEYGKWVAKEPIYIGNALAFNTGHPVPNEHVRLGVVSKDQVEAAPTPPKAPAAEAKK